MSPEEAEVVRLEQVFIGAWNKGDARVATSVYAEDGLRVGAFGDVSHGRREIEAAYQKLLNGSLRGATADWQPTVRLLAAEVAIAEGPLTIHPPGGAPILRGYAVDIWKKIDGHWQLLEGHPKLFPPPLK